ncbi:MAG: AraC family transcriptional regulator [Pseudomonadota bacterium]
MPRRYRDIYPSPPLLNSDELEYTSAAALMSVQYFRAEPDTMPEEVFSEHHILLNLQEKAHRVQNMRDGELRDFTFHKDTIIVTPAGMRSGWRWFETSDVIVVTLDPERVERFAQTELGMLLDPQQFRDLPQFSDPDLCAAGVMLRDALDADDIASAVMFEAMSRVLLVKLLQRYGKRRPEEIAMSARLTSEQYHRVLAFIRHNLDQTISVDQLASEAGMSPSHFNQVFKETLGSTPMQYVQAYRVEQAAKMMRDQTRPLGDIAHACGFADQAHFSRTFKQLTGQTPRGYRSALLIEAPA